MHAIFNPSWSPLELPPALDGSAVHVWRLAPPPASTDGLPLHWLDEEERSRAARLMESKRPAYLHQRVSRRWLLGAYTQTAPESLRLTVGDTGKPRLLPPHDGLHFNLSHGGDQCLIAFSRCPVGIDLELVAAPRRMREVARRLFGTNFGDQLEEMSDSEATETFVLAWTGMEARQKLHGVGIFGSRIPPEAVSSLHFHPADQYLASLAVTPQDGPLSIAYFDLVKDFAALS